MQKRKQKMIVIIAVITVAVIGSALSRVFILNQQIDSVNPRALRSGTSLTSRGISSNRMQYASLTTDTGTTESSGKSTKLSFETLGGWTYIEGKTPIPDDVKKFDGQEVELSGFMMPLTQTDQITEFMMIQALWGCCYGKPPAVNHVVMVKMTGGQSVKFYPEPIRVRGKFNVGETKQDGFLVSLYRLDAESIQAK